MRIKDLHLKRAVTAVLFVLLLSVVGMTNAMAQTFTSGDLKKRVTSFSVFLILHADLVQGNRRKNLKPSREVIESHDLQELRKTPQVG